MRKLNTEFLSLKIQSQLFNTLLTLDICYTHEIFVPLHCQNKDGDDAPSRGKRFSHVH